LLDEYAALGIWLPRGNAADATATLADLAAERNFDPASAATPITLTETHDDPVVYYDAIWVAGLDAAQWPASPRPDVFIPLRLQVAAGIPAASAQGQTQMARASLVAWRRAANELTCSWGRMEGDAHRSLSPLLAPWQQATGITASAAAGIRPSLAAQLRQSATEPIEDAQGVAVDTAQPVRGGVRPLELQAECGFHAYAETRLAAKELEAPVPGVNARERGMLMHKALELVWIKLKDHLHLQDTERERIPLIADSVEAAVVSVFRGHVPLELRPAVEREKHRLERLIAILLKVEQARPPFAVVALESPREVSIAGGRFAFRIDRIDAVEGGGIAILDYKSGEARAPRWQGAEIRDPQLLAYLLAERGRDVQALANVSLAGGRAKFSGKSSRTGFLPGVRAASGLKSGEASSADLDEAWRAQLEHWLASLGRIAARYLAGLAPVEPAPDVCRHCHLTVLCRRVELRSIELDVREEGADE
jgi:ATP-dependent helicase/nuclease subunit B